MTWFVFSAFFFGIYIGMRIERILTANDASAEYRCPLCGVKEGLKHWGGCADQNPAHPDGLIVRRDVCLKK